jgi:hypothetical protein
MPFKDGAQDWNILYMAGFTENEIASFNGSADIIDLKTTYPFNWPKIFDDRNTLINGIKAAFALKNNGKMPTPNYIRRAIDSFYTGDNKPFDWLKREYQKARSGDSNIDYSKVFDRTGRLLVKAKTNIINYRKAVKRRRG